MNFEVGKKYLNNAGGVVLIVHKKSNGDLVAVSTKNGLENVLEYYSNGKIIGVHYSLTEFHLVKEYIPKFEATVYIHYSDMVRLQKDSRTGFIDKEVDFFWSEAYPDINKNDYKKFKLVEVDH